MNNDLISREALLENAQRMTEYDEAGFGVPVRVVKVEHIENAPAVDAVEVVRCKDCTEWDKAEGECKHWYGFRETDFCSCGERKT